MESSTYFHMKTKILADLQVCISVPLTFNSLVSKAANNELHALTRDGSKMDQEAKGDKNTS